MKAILTNVINGISFEVHSTTEHPDSSYGHPVWVDCDEHAYFEVGHISPFYKVEILEK